MTVSNSSPNVDNYFVGKGIVKWMGSSDVAFRDVGNVPTLEFTPALDKLDHFSSRSGVRTKDRSIVREKSATLRIVMEELTADNLALALMGTAAVSSPATIYSIDIFAESEITGYLRFIGQNDVGAKVQLDFPNVSITPSAAFSPISDEWGQLEFTAEVLADVDTGSFGTALWNITEEVLMGSPPL